MNNMKQIVLSLLLVFASVVNAQNVNSLDPTQVYNTGNLTTFNQNGSQTTTPWQNVGQYGGSITCWGPGNPGYCGPKPYVNAWGPESNVINFSYGNTDLHQVVNIANALPNSGTGLRVNGFNFGFLAKNGNGWDNGQQDYLVAYVNFYGSDGKTVQSYNYGNYTNQKYNWTQFNFSETFATPYSSKDLSTARYGFVGYDTNFWAGPYGPEISNVSFSLKYSVDPCYTNVLSSPSCPGYMEALAKLNPAPSPIEPVNTQTNNTIIEPLPPTTVSTANTNTNTNNTNSTPTNQVTTSSTSPTTTTTATVSTPSGSGKESTSNGTSIGLSVVARNQQREQAIAMQAAQSAVAAADQVATQTQQDALNVAALSSSNSLTFALSNTRSSVMNSQIQSNSGSVSQQTQTNASSQSIFSLMPPSMVTANNNNQSTQQNLSVTPSVSQSFVNSNIQPTSITFNETLNMDTQKLLTDRTNPLNQVLENKPIEPQVATTSLQGSTVNRNVQNNELAGGVDLTRIAQAPTGYNEYLNFTLRDAAFYAPKEVYKNQRVIDNTRVLRQLSSDRLHQEMVEQQYRR